MLETHGGLGRIYDELYRYAAAGGVVLDADARKHNADALALQRPQGWRVYEGDSEVALAAGLAADVPFDLIDVDAYGSPFETIAAVFGHPRTLPDVVQLVVNDGLRQKAQYGGAWDVLALRDIVREWGNNLFDRYLDVAKEKVRRLVAPAGFELSRWYGYYCGPRVNMTHYWAELRRA